MDSDFEVEKRVLGVRAEPTVIHWAVVSGTPQAPVLEASGTETAPTAYNEGETLAWIRDRTLHIIRTYKPLKTAVRFPERNARGANRDSAKSRCRMEGVVLEASSSSGLEVVTGTLATFGKHSGTKSSKEDLTQRNLRGLDWSRHNERVREAILVAASILPIR